jgi:hypothetical protein
MSVSPPKINSKKKKDQVKGNINPKETRKINHCGKKGHLARHCWELHPEMTTQLDSVEERASKGSGAESKPKTREFAYGMDPELGGLII